MILIRIPGVSLMRVERSPGRAVVTCPACGRVETHESETPVTITIFTHAHGCTVAERVATAQQRLTAGKSPWGTD